MLYYGTFTCGYGFEYIYFSFFSPLVLVVMFNHILIDLSKNVTSLQFVASSYIYIFSYMTNSPFFLSVLKLNSASVSRYCFYFFSIILTVTGVTLITWPTTWLSSFCFNCVFCSMVLKAQVNLSDHVSPIFRSRSSTTLLSNCLPPLTWIAGFSFFPCSILMNLAWLCWRSHPFTGIWEWKTTSSIYHRGRWTHRSQYSTSAVTSPYL